MHILYFQMPDDKPYSSPLLGKRKFDAVYVDAAGQKVNLLVCLEKLESGDTLYIERMSCLGESVNGAVRELRGLALRGVNVWCERSGELLKSASSPFLSLTEELAQAMVDFRNVFMRFRQDKGRKEARERGGNLGKRKFELPANFEEVREAWRRKELTLVEAAVRCRMSVSTFWSKARAREQELEEQGVEIPGRNKKREKGKVGKEKEKVNGKGKEQGKEPRAKKPEKGKRKREEQLAEEEVGNVVLGDMVAAEV